MAVSYLSKTSIWVTALAMNVDSVILCTPHDVSEMLTQTAAFEVGLEGCLSQACDRLTCTPAAWRTHALGRWVLQPLPLLAGPTAWAQAQHFWSKLVQISTSQSTGSVNAYDLPHHQTANQTCYPYWKKKGLWSWFREFMIGKEITPLLMIGLSKPLGCSMLVCNILNFS